MLHDLKTRDLQVYFTNPQVEAVLTKYDYAAQLDRSTTQDGLYVVQANLSASKASQYVKTIMHDTVTLDAKGGATTCCNFVSYIIRSVLFMGMIRIMTTYEFMSRQIVNFFGEMASIQAYLSVVVSINNVNPMESIRKANYFVRQVNSNQVRLLLPSLILMVVTGIPSIPLVHPPILRVINLDVLCLAVG